MRSSPAAVCCLTAFLAMAVSPMQAAAKNAPAGKAADTGTPAPVPDDFLDTLKQEHPRLLLSEARLQELKELAGTDLLLQRYVKDVLQAADHDLTAQPLKHVIPDGLRLLATSRACLARMLRLGLAWRWTGERKYANQGIANLLSVCAFEDWNPRHFLDTAEMSAAVGIGYDWFFPAMDDKTRRTIRQGLIKLGMKAPPGWGVNGVNNWNMVCNGGLTVGALAIADTDPEYAKRIIPRAVANLPTAAKYYAPDGAWNEGPAYWQYATSYMALLIAACDSVLGHDLGVGATPGYGDSGWFPIYTAGPSGFFLCFADADLGKVNDPQAKGRDGMEVMFFLARKYKNPEFSAAEHQVLKTLSAEPLHVVWYDPPQAPAPRQLDRLFRGSVPVAVMRSAWNDRNALWVGVKGGFNKVNHGHLDLGNFEMEAQGVRWALDLGSDNYNLPGYFGNQRWDYWRLQSESHNVLLIAGKGQLLKGDATITACADGRTVVDLTTAYDDRATQVVRTVMLNQPRTTVEVTDQLDLKAAAEVVWGMTTDAAITIAADGSAMLARNGRQLKAIIVAPKNASFTSEVTPQEPQPHKSNAGYRRLIAKIAAPAGNSAITIRLEPMPGEKR